MEQQETAFPTFLPGANEDIIMDFDDVGDDVGDDDNIVDDNDDHLLAKRFVESEDQKLQRMEAQIATDYPNAHGYFTKIRDSSSLTTEEQQQMKSAALDILEQAAKELLQTENDKERLNDELKELERQYDDDKMSLQAQVEEKKYELDRLIHKREKMKIHLINIRQRITRIETTEKISLETGPEYIFNEAYMDHVREAIEFWESHYGQSNDEKLKELEKAELGKAAKLWVCFRMIENLIVNEKLNETSVSKLGKALRKHSTKASLDEVTTSLLSMYTALVRFGSTKSQFGSHEEVDEAEEECINALGTCINELINLEKAIEQSFVDVETNSFNQSLHDISQDKVVINEPSISMINDDQESSSRDRAIINEAPSTRTGEISANEKAKEDYLDQIRQRISNLKDLRHKYEKQRSRRHQMLEEQAEAQKRYDEEKRKWEEQQRQREIEQQRRREALERTQQEMAASQVFFEQRRDDEILDDNAPAQRGDDNAPAQRGDDNAPYRDEDAPYRDEVATQNDTGQESSDQQTEPAIVTWSVLFTLHIFPCPIFWLYDQKFRDFLHMPGMNDYAYAMAIAYSVLVLWMMLVTGVYLLLKPGEPSSDTKSPSTKPSNEIEMQHMNQSNQPDQQNKLYDDGQKQKKNVHDTFSFTGNVAPFFQVFSAPMIVGTVQILVFCGFAFAEEDVNSFDWADFILLGGLMLFALFQLILFLVHGISLLLDWKRNRNESSSKKQQ